MYETNMYEGMLAETISIRGYNNDPVYTYFAKPLGPGPFPGVVLVHHLPGWDEFYRETARRFAHHGYLAICPNLYQRFGHGAPDDVTAKVRSEGGVSDDSVVADSELLCSTFAPCLFTTARWAYSELVPGDARPSWWPAAAKDSTPL